MFRKYVPHSPDAQRRATETGRDIARDTITAVEAMQQDRDRAQRHAKGECPTCFYLRSRRIGGAAMTTWHCGICGTAAVAGSTATPKVCGSCATAHTLCAQCGGDQEGRTRRRTWVTPGDQAPDPAPHEA